MRRKHLQKVLLALGVVALLVSCIATMATAAPSQYVEIKPYETYQINPYAGQEAYLKFTPKASGVFILESAHYRDTKVNLYDENMTLLASDDNGKTESDEGDFRLACRLEGGKTYYYGVSFVNASYYGPVRVSFSCRDMECDHKNVRYHAGRGPSCHFDGYTEGNWCLDCETWAEGHVIMAGGHTDDNKDDLCDRCKGEVPHTIVECGPTLQPHLVKAEIYEDYSAVIFGTGPMGNLTSLTNGRYVNLLTKVTILEGITNVAEQAFSGYKKITSVTLPDGIEHIGHSAFYGCEKLESINIPEGVTYIGWGAFSGCKALKEISVPDSVSSIGMQAFTGCSAMTAFEGGVNIGNIGEQTFWGCTSLKSIYLGDNVYSLGKEAFKNCTGLTMISGGKELVTVGESAFYGCTALTDIELQENVQYIRKSAFYGCTALKCVTGLKTVADVGESAFYGCSQLAAIHFYRPLHNIGNSAFENCTALEDVSVPATLQSVGVKSFQNCTALVNVYYGGDEQDKLTIQGGENNIYFYRAAQWHFETCVGSKAHAFDASCDVLCDDCAYFREASHEFTVQKYNIIKHWYECACGLKDTSTMTDHTLTDRRDENSHWKGCDCGYQQGEQQHVYANYDSDDTYHWKTCLCGAVDTATKTKHNPSYASCGNRQSCLDCWRVLSESLPHSYKTVILTKATTTKDGKKGSQCTACGDVTNETTIYKASSVKLSATSYTYNGKAQTPTVKVKDSKGNTVSSAHYTVTYADGRKNVGTYKVTIKFKGNYSGTKELSFKINPISVSKCTVKLSATSYT